jgi:hypothetical protein
MMVHAGAQIDEPLWTLDQGGQDVHGKRVDREEMRYAVGGSALRLAIADSGIVDHSIKVAYRVNLRRDILGASDRVEIANDDGLGLRYFSSRSISALSVARMKDHLVSFARKQFAGHQPEACTRSRNENPRHEEFFLIRDKDRSNAAE